VEKKKDNRFMKRKGFKEELDYQDEEYNFSKKKKDRSRELKKQRERKMKIIEEDFVMMEKDKRD